MIDPKAIDKERSQALKQRMELNRKARFGLQDATPEQLNIIYLICRHLDLDPLEDITLMHGHPWYTVHGTFRMMRRHPEYAGFRQWPLAADDKLIGGWAETDIVWATEIRTKSWGPIVQWGKVTREEIQQGEQRKTPIATNYVEMAQKRSAQHAIRAAFGHEAAPDEQQIEQMMAEEIARRQDPERIKQLSDKYEQIYGGEDDWSKAKPLPPEPVTAYPASDENEADTDPEPVAKQLEQQVEADAQTDSKGTVQHLLSLAWQRHRLLQHEAIRLRLRPRVLRNSSTLAEVSKANHEIEQLIAEATTEEPS